MIWLGLFVRFAPLTLIDMEYNGVEVHKDNDGEWVSFASYGRSLGLGIKKFKEIKEVG